MEGVALHNLEAGVAVLGAILQDPEAGRRRAASFARQLAVPSPDPFLRYRDQRWCGEGCPSCGIGLRAHERWRCDAGLPDDPTPDDRAPLTEAQRLTRVLAGLPAIGSPLQCLAPRSSTAHREGEDHHARDG